MKKEDIEKWEIDESDLHVNTWIQTEANGQHGHIRVARIYHGDKQKIDIAKCANLIVEAPVTFYNLQGTLKVLKSIAKNMELSRKVTSEMAKQAIKDFS